MHPTMQHCVNERAVLHEQHIPVRTNLLGEVDRAAPSSTPKYYATAKGKMWHIINANTGKTCAFRTNYKKALCALDVLVERASNL